MKKKLAKRTIRSFLLWYLCFLLLAGVVITASQLVALRAEKATYLQGLSADAQRLMEYFGLDLRGVVDSGNSIFLSRWYKHYRNNANIYEDEFDGLRKMEILEDLRFRMTSMAYVSDILIITPPPLDTIITPNGWFSFADYAKIYGAVRVEYPDGYTQPPAVSALGDGVCLVTLQDSTPRRLQGVICMVVDKKSFAGMFERMLPAHVVSAQATLGEQALYGEVPAAGAYVVNTVSTSVPIFSLTFYSRTYEATLLPARLVHYGMMMAIAVFACGLLSALVIWLTLKPMRNLLEKYGLSSHAADDPYQFVDGYMEAYSAANARLRMEQESSRRSMTQFLSQMRNEILFGIVTNPELSLQREQLRMCIPWVEEGLPFLLVLLKHQNPNAAGPVEEAPLAEWMASARHACAFPVFYRDLCVMLWYDTWEEAHRRWQGLPAALDALSQGRFRHAFSPPLQDLSQAHGQYVALEAALPPDAGARLELPLATQIRLINLLHGEKAEEYAAWLAALEAEGRLEPDALLRFLLRMALEYEVDARGFADAYQQKARGHDAEGQWSILLPLGEALFDAIHALRHEGINQTAETIRRFIDENYRDPDLSMQTLSDRFGMHRTLISRLVKAHLGVTFSEYVQSLRMDQAISMMRNAEWSITAIAEAVGYANYITFKRAFVRRHGVTPSEYRGLPR